MRAVVLERLGLACGVKIVCTPDLLRSKPRLRHFDSGVNLAGSTFRVLDRVLFLSSEDLNSEVLCRRSERNTRVVAISQCM